MYPMMRPARHRENSTNFRVGASHAYEDTLLQSMIDIQSKQKLQVGPEDFMAFTNLTH